MVAETPSVVRKLRGWALGFLFSQDYKRAAQLLDRALCFAELPETNDRFGVSEHDLAAMELAVVEARKNNLTRAQQLSAPILAKYAGCPSALAIKAAQLCDAYESCGHLSEAESLLRSETQKSGQRNARTQWDTREVLNRHLLRICALRNENEEAMALAKDVTVTDFETRLILADLEYESKDYDKAAHYCSLLLSRVANPWPIEPAPLKMKVVTRAIDAADQAKGLSASERSKLLVSAADALREMEPSKAEIVYKRAAAMLPDESQEKERILRNLTQLEPKANPLDTIRNEIKWAERVEAEKGPRYFDRWVGVARLEIDNNLVNEGIKHLEHSLMLLRGADTQSILGPMFSFNQTVLESLYKTGRKQDCQRLLQEATRAAEATYGGNSHEAASEWAAQANLAALNNDPSKVFESAHRSLAIYESLGCKLPRANGAFAAPEIVGLFNTVKALAKVGEKDKSLTLIGEVIDVQRRRLADGSTQLQHSLQYKGWMLTQQRNYGAAAMAYTQARDAARKNGNENADAGELAYALKQLGRTKEADDLLAVKVDRKPAQSCFSLESEAQQCLSQGHIDHARQLFEKAVASTNGEYSLERLHMSLKLAAFFDGQRDYRRG